MGLARRGSYATVLTVALLCGLMVAPSITWGGPANPSSVAARVSIPSIPTGAYPAGPAEAPAATGASAPVDAPSLFLLPPFTYASCASVNGAVSPGAGGAIVNISWSWGDNSTTYGFFPMTHNYSAPGTYNLTVTARDASGATTSETEAVTVDDSPWPEPSSTLSMTPASVSGKEVTVDGLADINECGPLSDPNPGGFLWDWGDGQQTRSYFPASHAYASPGEYEVCVTVVDTFNVSNQQCEGVLVEAPTVPIEIFANESSVAPGTPVLGQEFTWDLAMRDGGSTPATPPATLTLASSSPLTAQSPSLNCTSQDDFPALGPATTVLVPYVCTADWAFVTPGRSLGTAFASYASTAAGVVENLTQDGVLAYAAQVLSGPVLAAFEDGWNSSSFQVGAGVTNDTVGIGGIIQLAAAGDLALGVNLSITLPSDPAYTISLPAGPVAAELVAGPTQIAAAAGWLSGGETVPPLDAGSTSGGLSNLPACGALGSCAPTAALLALGLLEGPFTTGLVGRVLTDPNLDFTSFAIVPALPGVLANLSNVTAPVLTDEFYVVQDLNASVLSIARGYAALGAHADYAATEQFSYAASLAENGSTALLGLEQNASLLDGALAADNRTNFQQGVGLLNMSGLPGVVTDLLAAVGLQGELNTTALAQAPFANLTTAVLASAPDLGSVLNAAAVTLLAALAAPTSVTTNATVLNGEAQFDDSSITGVSVTLSSPSTTAGTAVALTSTQTDGKPRGTGFAPVSDPLGYFDVNLTGVSTGTATVCLVAAGIGPATRIAYWDGSVWVALTHASDVGLSSCAAFTPAELHGTPIVIGTPTATDLVTVQEVGLPGGTRWSASLGAPPYTASNTTGTTGGRLRFEVPPGVEPLVLNVPAGYGVARLLANNRTVANQTSIDIAGAATVTVRFGKLEALVFRESANPTDRLYSGAAWSVALTAELSGGPAGQFDVTTGATIDFSVPTGAAYRFSVLGPSSYASRPAHGSLAVPAHAASVTVRFVLETERVAFRETGLAHGTSWSVTLTNGTAAAMTFPLTVTTRAGRAITFALPVGNYSFRITAASGAVASPASGTVEVAEAGPPPQTITVQFAP